MNPVEELVPPPEQQVNTSLFEGCCVPNNIYKNGLWLHSVEAWTELKIQQSKRFVMQYAD